MENIIGKQVKVIGMGAMFNGGEFEGEVLHVWETPQDNIPELWNGLQDLLCFQEGSLFVRGSHDNKVVWVAQGDYEVISKDFIVGETYIVTQDTSFHLFPVGTQVVFKGRDSDGDAMFYPLGKFESEFRWVEDHDVKEVTR